MKGATLRLAVTFAIGLVVVVPLRALGAGGAYAVDDADIGKSGSCQVENWLSTASRHDFVGVISPACVVTIGMPVEFTFLYQRSSTSGDWTTAYAGQAKVVPINNDRYAWSMVAAVAYDTLTRSESGFINMPLTFKFGKDFRTHTNLGWLYDGRVARNFATGGFGFEWDFASKFSLQGEIYLQGRRKVESLPSTIHDPRTQLGLRYMPVGTVDIDFIYGQNLTGRSQHWLTLGLTLRSE